MSINLNALLFTIAYIIRWAIKSITSRCRAALKSLRIGICVYVAASRPWYLRLKKIYLSARVLLGPIYRNLRARQGLSPPAHTQTTCGLFFFSFRFLCAFHDVVDVLAVARLSPQINLALPCKWGYYDASHVSRYRSVHHKAELYQNEEAAYPQRGPKNRRTET